MRTVPGTPLVCQSEKSHTCSHINRMGKSLLPSLSVSFPTQKKHPKQQQSSTQVCGHRRVTKSLEVAAVNQASNCSQLKSSPPLSHSLVQYAKQQQHKNLTLKRTEDFRKSRESRTPFLSDEESLQSCSHAVRKKINNSQQPYT